MRLPTNYEIRIAEERKRRAPIVCCECGDECSHYGQFQAADAGWQGFSNPISVKQLDGTRRRERVGMCPGCVVGGER